jgi:hypothetical protein
MDNDKAMLHDIITKVKQGSKAFIFYPYKNHSFNQTNISSMQQIHGAICEATNKKGIFYNADVDDTIKKGLKDVNTSWEAPDFIITNNIITCGVNYDKQDFDYIYIFVASHNSPRDIAQVSNRIRYVSSGIIKICYIGKMNQNNTWLNDCDKINCPIYSQLYRNILVEKKAPLKRSLQLFCCKAHYKQKTDDYKINDTVEKELKDIIDKQNVGITYHSIPDIDWSQAEYIEEQCFAQQATMLEKYALNKYYFKKSFTDSVEPDLLAQIWNNKFTFFFKRLGTILLNENHIFNKIASHNKLTNLFPVDVKKTKLTDELKQEIFKEFSFKFITDGSTTTKIIKEIYNTYFNKHIVTTTYYNNSKDMIYEIDKDVYDYYNIAKDCLILDSQTYMTYNTMNALEEDCIAI